MTVGQLIDELENHGRDKLVVIQKDSEGYVFSPLADVTSGWYKPSAMVDGMGDSAFKTTKGAVPTVYLIPRQ